MTHFLRISSIAAGIALVGIATMSTNSALARDQIQIVGSSTVFPFATAVAEKFGSKTQYKTPIVESTGSGGGMKLFCAGIGQKTPDIANSSRRIKKREFNKCLKNGVTVVEVKIGYDGIVLANSTMGSKLDISLKHVFAALARKIPGPDGSLIMNPYIKWSDIDLALPNIKIKVLGPPPTSGTRDAFAELAMEGGAKKFPSLAALRKKDKRAFKKIAHAIREDGAYVEAGENDNLIIQKLGANSDSFGIFGFSFLDQNADKVQAASVNGIDPEFELISSGDYPISRSLYFYVKKQHVGIVPGMAEYVAEFVNEDSWAEEGYLAEKGLIPLSADDRKVIANDVKSLKPLVME